MKKIVSVGGLLDVDCQFKKALTSKTPPGNVCFLERQVVAKWVPEVAKFNSILIGSTAKSEWQSGKSVYRVIKAFAEVSDFLFGWESIPMRLLTNGFKRESFANCAGGILGSLCL